MPLNKLLTNNGSETALAVVASMRTGGLCQFIISVMNYTSPIVKAPLKECVVEIT